MRRVPRDAVGCGASVGRSAARLASGFPWKLGAYHAFYPVHRYAGRRRGKGCQAGQRHCVDSLFPDADLFRHNAADRGHAARDAEDRPFLPAHTGDYDDEKCFFSDLRGQHTGAGLRNDRRCCALHGALRALFSLGVNECASGKISKWNKRQSEPVTSKQSR